MTDRRTLIFRVAVALILLGTCSNLGFAIHRLFGSINLFALAVLLWVVSPWLLLAATLRLRPLGVAPTIFIMLAALVLTIVSTTVYYNNFIAPPDSLDGVIFIFTPFMELMVAGIVFSFVWSSVRSKRNAGI